MYARLTITHADLTPIELENRLKKFISPNEVVTRPRTGALRRYAGATNILYLAKLADYHLVVISNSIGEMQATLFFDQNRGHQRTCELAWRNLKRALQGSRPQLDDVTLYGLDRSGRPGIYVESSLRENLTAIAGVVTGIAFPLFDWSEWYEQVPAFTTAVVAVLLGASNWRRGRLVWAD